MGQSLLPAWPECLPQRVRWEEGEERGDAHSQVRQRWNEMIQRKVPPSCWGGVSVQLLYFPRPAEKAAPSLNPYAWECKPRNLVWDWLNGGKRKSFRTGSKIFVFLKSSVGLPLEHRYSAKTVVSPFLTLFRMQAIIWESGFQLCEFPQEQKHHYLATVWPSASCLTSLISGSSTVSLLPSCWKESAWDKMWNKHEIRYPFLLSLEEME